MNKLIVFFFLLSLTAWSQISLPIQQSVLPKNSLVVNYDFLKSSSFTRGSGTVTNIAGTTSGNASVVSSPIFINSLGFVSLNGTTQYVVTPNLRTYFKAVNATIQNSFTISFWVYPTATSGNLIYELDSQTPNYAWNASNIELVNGYVKYRVWNGSAAGPLVTSSTTVNLNQWYHIAMVYDGTSIKGYLNGSLQGSQVLTRIIPTAGQFYAIGAGGGQNMGSSAYGKFNLAQFKLSNLPFSDKDVLQEYESRKSEFDYTIHSPQTNVNPTYWNVSSRWDNSSGSSGPGATFGDPHYNPWINSELGWAAQSLGTNPATNQWITLNYDEPVYIKGIVAQPRANEGDQYVTKVLVETSMTGAAPWTTVVSNDSLMRNKKDDARILFASSAFAKYIKVTPLLWTNHMTMRLGALVKPNNTSSSGLVLRLDAANLKSYSGTGAVWNDISGNALNGTLTNGPTFSPNNGGNFIFDGVNDFVEGPALTSTSGNNSRTVMAWYKSTTSQSICILDKGSSGTNNAAEQFFIANQNGAGEAGFYPPTNPGGVYVAFWGNDIYYPIASSTLFDGNWHFVAYTYNASNKNVSICFDGVFASSIYYMNGVWNTLNTKPFVLTTTISTTDNPYWIGRTRAKLWARGVDYSNAAIGAVNIFNRSLSEQEIVDYYNAFKPRY